MYAHYFATQLAGLLFIMVSLLSDRGASGFASESVPFLADTEKEQADADEQLTAWRAGCRLCNAYRNRPHSWHTWSFGVLALLIYTGIVVSITISGTRRVGSSKTPWCRCPSTNHLAMTGLVVADIHPSSTS